MKFKLLFTGLILLLISCNTSQEDDRSTDDMVDESEMDSKDSADDDSLEAIWTYDYNQQTQDFELKQVGSVDKNTLTAETIEKIINKSWPRVQIKYIKTSNDTVFISIPDSKTLTQQMGSAGAMGFMISTTFSLTELKGIDYVYFDFEVGDHATPGVYNRNSWDQNITR